MAEVAPDRPRTAAHVNLLRRHNMYLMQHLQPMVNEIVYKMLQENQLTQDQSDRILQQETPDGSVAILLSIIQVGDRQMFFGFLQALRQLQCDDVLEVLIHDPLGEINEAEVFPEVDN